MAAKYQVALATNVMTFSIPEQLHHITQIIFDNRGTVVSTYDKYHLFPTELTIFSPGPFKPTVFEMFGITWGIIICYEGFYPSITGDYSQMEGLMEKGG